MRIIIYTGKGGVGKTSIAAATACHLASADSQVHAGKKGLIISTDQAHSLSDSFDCKLGREPVQVTQNLDAMEIDSIYESEKSWGRLHSYLKEMLTAKSTDGIEAEELLVFPGLEELFSLFRILDFYEAGNYDVIIVDCAPTGETLSLLKYPEMLSGTIEKILPFKKKALKTAGPLVEKIMKIPMPEESVFDDITYVMDKMERLQKLLLDKETVSLRIVTTPEKVVIQETKRNFTCLHLYDYNVDAIFINRIYPQEAMEGYFSKWLQMQQEGLQEIAESFSEIPRFMLSLQKNEIVTLPVLKEIAHQLFEVSDPYPVLFHEKIYSLSRTDNQLLLTIWLPFAKKEELELTQEGSELLLRVGNESRRFPLPQELSCSDISAAKLDAGYLTITFDKVSEKR